MFDFNKPIKMCTRRSCCPTIEFDESGDNPNAIIKDDFGGEVIISLDELKLMGDIFKEFKRSKPDMTIETPEFEVSKWPV